EALDVKIPVLPRAADADFDSLGPFHCLLKPVEFTLGPSALIRRAARLLPRLQDADDVAGFVVLAKGVRERVANELVDGGCPIGGAGGALPRVVVNQQLFKEFTRPELHVHSGAVGVAPLLPFARLLLDELCCRRLEE